MGEIFSKPEEPDEEVKEERKPKEEPRRGRTERLNGRARKKTARRK